MLKLTKILGMLIGTFLLMGVLTGCIGHVESAKSMVDSTELKPVKTAVIVPLFGPVSPEWLDAAEKVFQNPRYNLVVFWIESPGGSVTETILLTHKLKMYQKKYHKQVYIYSERILASGAYWVAASFETIIVSPVCKTGSIGAYMQLVSYTELFKKAGIKYTIIASDSTKIMGHPTKPLEDWQRKYFQSKINNIHVTFMEHVLINRWNQIYTMFQYRNGIIVKTHQDTVQVFKQFRQIANGLTYQGKKAWAMGLVDNVMYFDEFVKKLKQAGYIVVTADGKYIDDKYIFSDKEDSVSCALQEVHRNQHCQNSIQLKQK